MNKINYAFNEPTIIDTHLSRDYVSLDASSYAILFCACIQIEGDGSKFKIKKNLKLLNFIIIYDSFIKPP